MVNFISSATTPDSSMRIILPTPLLLVLIEYLLPLLYFMAGSAFAATGTSYGNRPPKISCQRVSLRSSFERVLETLGRLKMSFRIGLGETISTNRRKYKIEPPTL